MSNAHDPNRPSALYQRRDTTIPILIGILGGGEVVVLYVLFFFETPLTPFARRETETIAGTVALVILVLTVLCFAVAVGWALMNKYRKSRRQKHAV
jgi:threonine/homoserine/homoserine lactone efflux protein